MQHFLSFVFSSSSLLSLLFYFTWYQSPLANTSQSWFLLRCNTLFQPFYQTRLTHHMVLPKNRASSLPLPTFQLHPHRNYPRFYSILVFISISPNLLSFTQKKCISPVLSRHHKGLHHHHEISGILCPTNTSLPLTAQAADLPVSSNDSLLESPPSTSDASLFLV